MLDPEFIPDYIDLDNEEGGYNPQQRITKLEKLLLIPKYAKTDYQIEEIWLLLAADYQVFAKLKEQNKDLKEIVKSISMVSYEANVPIITIGEENHEFVYIVMSGFLGAFQNFINEETGIKEK